MVYGRVSPRIPVGGLRQFPGRAAEGNFLPRLSKNARNFAERIKAAPAPHQEVPVAGGTPIPSASPRGGVRPPSPPVPSGQHVDHAAPAAAVRWAIPPGSGRGRPFSTTVRPFKGAIAALAARRRARSTAPLPLFLPDDLLRDLHSYAKRERAAAEAAR